MRIHGIRESISGGRAQGPPSGSRLCFDWLAPRPCLTRWQACRPNSSAPASMSTGVERSQLSFRAPICVALMHRLVGRMRFPSRSTPNSMRPSLAPRAPHLFGHVAAGREADPRRADRSRSPASPSAEQRCRQRCLPAASTRTNSASETALRASGHRDLPRAAAASSTPVPERPPPSQPFRTSVVCTAGRDRLPGRGVELLPPVPRSKPIRPPSRPRGRRRRGRSHTLRLLRHRSPDVRGERARTGGQRRR